MLACHEYSWGLNPVHSTWRLLLYFLFLKFFPMLLKHCHNAAVMLCVFIAQYMATISPSYLIFLNTATTLFIQCYNAAVHSPSQIPDTRQMPYKYNAA